MNSVCCGFGHRDYPYSLYSELTREIKQLIEINNVHLFFTGDMGKFDNEFSICVNTLKQKNRDVKLILIKPYFSDRLNTEKDYYTSKFDDIIIPEEICNCHFKSAITKRNEWIVRQSAFVLSGVFKEYGGSYNAIKYAEKQNKTIIDLTGD